MHKNKTYTPVAAAILALCMAGAAQAGDTIDLGNGLQLDWSLIGTYTGSQRMKSPNPVLANNAGGNDGDNNFGKGDLTANRISGLLQSKIYKGDSGFVFSASSFYDDVYHHANANNPAANNPNKVNHAPPFNQFTPGAVHDQGGYTRALDAYGYTSFDIGSSRATVRLGQQVVNWGVANFFPNIAYAQGPFDGTKAGIPGTEVKDSVLPEDQLSASIALDSRLTLLGQAQFGFHPTIAPAPGSFMSASDGVGAGGNCLGPYSTIPAIPATGFNGFAGCSFGSRGADILPSKTGQWGIGLRYRLTDATEVGAYYLNYSDRTPLPVINAFTPGAAIPAALRAAFGGITQIGNGSYNVRYFDNVKLVGGTVSTLVTDSTNLYGELAYKKGAPVLVNTLVNPATGATIPNPTRADVTQLNVGTFTNVGRTPIADSITLLSELSVVNVSNVQAIQAPGAANFPAAFGFTASNTLSGGSKNPVALALTAVFSYPGIKPGWDMTVPVSYTRQLRGYALQGGDGGGQGDTRYSVGVSFTYKGNLSIGLTYLGFPGSANTVLATQHLLVDRDQLSLVMKYAL